MKKSTITIVLCLVLFSQLGYSQPNYRQAALDSAANFYTMRADFETWLDTVQLSDSLKQRELKKFGRFASFWYPRVQCEDSQLSGFFSTYQNFLGFSWINPSCTGIDDAKWENVGPYPNDLQDMGFVQAIWFEKENPDTILVGSSRTGGIIKSIDRGKTWYDVLSPTRIPAYGISSFAVSPVRNPNNGKRVIYASTGSDKVGYSLGILKSVDGGETWSILEDFPPYYHRQFHIMVKKIVVYHYNGNDYLYAIANNRILTSDNGGLNWTDLVTITGVNGYIFNDIEICPNNNNIFVISGFPLEPQSQDPPLRAKMWITYNGGSNFSEILGNSGYNLVNQVSNVLLSFPASSNLYIHTASPTERKIILFEPSTSSWTIYNPNYKTGIGGQFNMFEVPGNCSYFYIGTETFSISSTTVKGSELIPYGIYPHTHPDIRCMDFLDDIIMLGSDGGVIYSDDHGNTWQSINGFGKDGLTNNEVMGMDITDTYEPEIIAGLFDNNFKHYHDQEWYSAIPTDVTYIQSNGPYFIQSDIGIGDIAQIAINEANHNEILMHSNYGLNYVTRNSNTYSALNDLTTSWHAVGHWYNSALERSKTNPDQVIRGGWEGKVYLSDDGGLTFSDPGIQLPGCTADVTRIKIAPSNPQIIYAMSIQNIGNNYTGYVLYRSDDGGNNWTDITGGANLQTSIQNQWYSATDFTIDWHDPNRVWVCMGGLPTQYPSGVPITKERVFTTYDASQGANTQWYDITGNSSSGLPPLPTSAIVNQPGTSRVFLATDGGIFYRDDNDPDWICFSNGFPITHVTDMKINRKTNEIFASTYGYGIFKSPLPCGSESLTPTEIDASSGDVTWSNVSKSLGDVYVRSGYTLTIDNNSVITMIPNSKIVVERGAKLVVDNATLTSCEEMWDGIIVYGNVFQPQAGNIQGKVELLNGATIANARAGVATGSARSAGGIIQADKAKFFNCEYAVKMHPYKNFNPNNPSQKLPESSFFKDCEFTTTGELIDPSTKPKSFIWVNGVHHLNITGNTFKNINPDEPYKFLCGKGIESYNSLINLHPLCTDMMTSPCTQWKPNSFSGLQTGVFALATQPNIPLSIKMATFEDNSKGVYLNSISNASVILSDFKVSTETNMDYETYGLYLDYCTGYTIEENNFYSEQGVTQTTTLGMVINNSGEETNEVYNNTFNDLFYGLIAQHDNRGIDKQTGLKIKCNDFSDVLLTDIGVTKGSGYNGITGISEYQGGDIDVTSPAGNTFSWKNLLYYSDINNNGLNISKYYHHDIQGSTPAAGENWVPLYYNSQKVFLEKATGKPYTNKPTACPSNTGGSGMTLSQLYLKMEAEQVNVNSANLVLSIWRDGGIPELPEQVELAYPWETYYYYNLLMLESPYLSDQTLIAAINNTDLLPDLLLKLVLIANPQCTRSEAVLLAIEEREPQLPEYMVYEIMLGEDVPSPLEALEATVSYHIHERQNALNRIATIYLNDTVNSYARDSLLALLDRDEYLNAKYAKAFIHLYENDFEALDIQMSDIETMLDGEDYQQQQYQEYLDFMEIARVMHEDSLSYDELTTSQKDTLHYLAENGSFYPAAYARTLLICNDPEFEYEEPIELPVVETYRKRSPVYFVPDTSGCSFKVYPNPALDYVILEYKMQNEDVTAVVHITDNKGRLINIIQLEEPVGQYVAGCKELTSGLYHFTLITKRKIVITKKVTIAK